MYIHICERPIEKVDLPFPIWIEDTALPGGSYAEAPLFSQRGRKTSVEIIYHGSSDSSNPCDTCLLQAKSIPLKFPC